MTRRLLRGRQGTTMVELVVCMLLVAVFALAATSLIQPCAQIFLRMQALSRAQMISDTVVDYLRGELLHAQGTLRLCEAGAGDPDESPGLFDAVFLPAADASGSTGTAVEFQVTTNVDRDENDVGRGDRAAAYKLIDAGAVPVTVSTRTGAPPVFAQRLPAGVLHERYFMPVTGGGYLYRSGGDYCAYAGTDAFPTGFYMGMAVRLRFSVYSWMEREPADPVRVTAMDVRVDVYADEKTAGEGGAPLYSRRAILDLADAPVLVQGSSPARAG